MSVAEKYAEQFREFFRLAGKVYRFFGQESRIRVFPMDLDRV